LLLVYIVIIYSDWCFFYIIKNFINKLNAYKNKLLCSKKNKIDIEEVLNLYNKEYLYKVDFEKEIHGIHAVKIGITFN
jgi:hypothetical protein